MSVFQAVTMAAQRKCAVISVGCKRWVFYWGEAPRGRSVKCVGVCVCEVCVCVLQCLSDLLPQLGGSRAATVVCVRVVN